MKPTANPGPQPASDTATRPDMPGQQPTPGPAASQGSGASGLNTAMNDDLRDTRDDALNRQRGLEKDRDAAEVPKKIGGQPRTK